MNKSFHMYGIRIWNGCSLLIISMLISIISSCNTLAKEEHPQKKTNRLHNPSYLQKERE